MSVDRFHIHRSRHTPDPPLLKTPHITRSTPDPIKYKQYHGHAPATAAVAQAMKTLAQYDNTRLLRRVMRLLKTALEAR